AGKFRWEFTTTRDGGQHENGDANSVSATSLWRERGGPAFIEKEPRMPIYEAPKNKIVKIKLMDKDLAASNLKGPDKAMDDLSKSFATWNTQRQQPPTPCFSSGYIPYKPAQAGKDFSTITCNYCGNKGHTLYRCDVCNQDELAKLCRREGNTIILPDEMVVRWDRSKCSQQSVDEFHRKKNQLGIIQLPPGTNLRKPENKPVVNTSVCKIESLPDPENSVYECDGVKRGRGNKEAKDTPYTKKRKT
ncbi:hypothetical protein MJO29_017009, partial [Puccinia striiformis f. sp. tritici]